MKNPFPALATRLPMLALAVMLAAVIPFAPARADDCNGATKACYNAGRFVAEVTSISPSWDSAHRTHYVRINVRFRNTGKQPVSLAFPWRSAATVVDNYGNTYGIDWRFPKNIVGIAVVGHGGVNGHFTIAPGQSRTASWVFNRHPGASAVGNVFSVNLPIDDMETLPGKQAMRVGNQYSLAFEQLAQGSSNLAATTAGSSDARDNAGCSGSSLPCFDAGVFAAEVTSVNPSWDRNHRTRYLRLNVRFRNTGSQPISLAFPWRSSASMVDNYGNGYSIDWRYPKNIVGIAVIGHDGVKGNFTIVPGSSRTASWILSLNPGNNALGNVFSAHLTIDDLQPIPGQQKVKVGNQYSLDFEQLSGGSPGLLGNATDGQGSRVEKAAEGIGLLLNALKKH